MNKEIEEMMLTVPQKIVAYDGNPAGQHLYGEQRQQIAEALYNAGYRKTFTSDFASDTQKAYKEGYIKGIEEREAENERLTERLKQVLLSIDTVKEMNAMCNIDEQRKQAVKEFAERIKNEVYPFLQAEMYNKKHFIVGDSEIDKLFENQNVGILKAQDVLSKWFKVKVDELLKEYNNGK